MKKIAIASIFLVAFATNASACSTLKEQLAHDSSIVKNKLLALRQNERLTGIHLCDESVVFKGWRFIRHVKVQGPFQHILLFQNGRSTRAVAWVEPRGKEMVVPVCPHGPRCKSLPESAVVISGDSYTFNTIKPQGDVVILSYPPADW